MKETFDRIRDRHDRVRAVVDSVRTDMRGEPRAEIAAELARRLATAGLPDLPENVDQKAALIVDLPDALISLGAALVRVVAGRPGPAGLRRESRYLDGATWTPVGVTDDPLAQRTLRVFDTMRPSDACEMYIGRLVAVPSDEVAVFLGSTFIGMLPPDAARAVRPIAEQTDAADQKLLVKEKSPALTPSGHWPSPYLRRPLPWKSRARAPHRCFTSVDHIGRCRRRQRR